MDYIYDNGQPWRLLYDTNAAQTGDITPWVAGTVLPAASEGGCAVMTNANTIYLLGGGTVNVYKATITNGIIGSWSTDTPLPGGVARGVAFLTRGRVYILGNTFSSAVYTAPVNDNGVIGTWASATPLSVARSDHAGLIIKNRAYLFGGYLNSGGNTATVITAVVNQDGTIGTWSSYASLPAALRSPVAIKTENKVYIIGGENSTDIYMAATDEDGLIGAWSNVGNIPNDISYAQAVTVPGMVYLLGGADPAIKDTVYRAPIDINGDIGAWSSGTVLPIWMAMSQAVVTTSKIYLLGGTDWNGVPLNTVYSAPFAGATASSYSFNLFWTNFHGQTEILP